ncbi:MAG: oligosaccharide flippase family protein [Jatrophihabitans sp.]|uniref:oligosaccharide flippase family protein n=1 Tax=Jatrophihabitans sp. TaxID=1932789 RepID=UPI003F81324B
MTAAPASPGALRNALANSGGQITALVIGIALTPLLVRHLGDTGYGVWALVAALQGLGGVLDLGVTASVVKYVAEYRARGEDAVVNRIIGTSVAVHFVLGSLAGVLTAAVAVWGLPHLHVGAAEQHEARVALLIAGVGLVVGLPTGVLASVLTGLARYPASNAVTVVQAVVSAGATVALVEAGTGPAGLIALNTVSLVGGNVARWLLARRAAPGLTVDVRLASRATMRLIGAYSVWALLLDVANRLFRSGDAVIIASVLPVAAVTEYNLGFRPSAAVAYLSAPAVGVLLPLTSALGARGASGEVHRLLVAATRLAVAITMPVVLWLAIWGGPAITVWVGPKHHAAVPILWAFLGLALTAAAQSAPATILRGTGRIRSLALVVGCEYVLNIALTIWLVHEIGALGAALGTLIPGAVNGALVIPWLACRALGVPWRRLAGQALLPPVLVAVPVAAGLLVLRTVLDAPTLTTLVLSAATAGLSYLALYGWWGAGDEERRIAAATVGGLRARRMARGGAAAADASSEGRGR